MNHISFRPQQSCKRDYLENIDTKFEEYKNNRDANLTEKTNNTDKKKDIDPPKEYKKEDFIEKFMELHNDVYFNPYKILEIDKNYDPESLKTKYKELALIYHPDRPTGDIEIFKDITKSYLYLLKKYKENIPDKQIVELKEEFSKFIEEQDNQKKTNILLQNERFDVNKFNSIFDDNNEKINNGYDNFMKDNENEEKESYIFSDKFNINIFNKIFDKNTRKKIKSEKVQLYKEPETVFQSSADYTELGEQELDDYTSGFNFDRKINFTDCKRAYSEPESIDCDIKTFENLEDLEKHRSDLSYNMSEQETTNYNNYLQENTIKEQNRQKRLERQDINILKKYNKINKLLIN